MYNVPSLLSRCALVLILLAQVSLRPAAASALTEEALRIQDTYQHLSSIRFTFQQQTATSGRVRKGTGEAVFVRLPEHQEQAPQTSSTIMRWNYSEPAEQIILNTGKELSVYTKNDNQLIITSTEQLESDITLALFAGKVDLTDTFHIVDQQPAGSTAPLSSARQPLELIPQKPHSQLQRLRIWYSADYLIEQLAMEDHFGSVTTIVLTNIQLNTVDTTDDQQLENILHMDIPPETEIIRQ